MSVAKLKTILRPIINVVRKRRLRKELTNQLNNSSAGYTFSQGDINLYIHERLVGLPSTSIDTVGDNSNLLKVTVKGTTIYWPTVLPPNDLPWLYHEIFDEFDTNPSSYDHPLIDFESKKWIMDAGAAEGYFSIFSILKSSALVIAVEPLGLMKTALEKTLDLYAADKKTTIVSAALSSECGWAEIQVNYEHICDSTLSSNVISTQKNDLNGVTERVSVTTIDQLSSQYFLGGDGMIKMDIEGYEMAALSGAVNLMRSHKPALAIAVYHDIENARKCADIIREANPNYKIEFRGCYGYFDPPRPYMLFAY